MILQQASRPINRRIVFSAAAAFLLIILALTGHQKRETISEFTGKALDSIRRPKHHPPWLLATISPAFSLQRRTLIRNTWQRLYRNDTRFATRFVIANATELWKPLIAAENETYGDIIMLPNVYEGKKEANSIKPMEFFSYLVNTTMEPWSFVSKIDDDSFLEANTFWEKFLRPVYEAEKPAENGTVWGVKKGDIGGYMFPYPGGQFYTLTWDLLQNITTYWNKHGSGDTFDEDALIGALLRDSKAKWNFEILPREGAYNFGGEGKDGPRGKDTAWANKDANLHAGDHGVAVGAFNLHNLKEDDTYLQVAACFDENGLKVSEWANGFVG